MIVESDLASAALVNRSGAEMRNRKAECEVESDTLLYTDQDGVGIQAAQSRESGNERGARFFCGPKSKRKDSGELRGCFFCDCESDKAGNWQGRLAELQSAECKWQNGGPRDGSR